MAAMYEIVNEDGERLPDWPDPLTLADAEAACRGEWALGVAAYHRPVAPQGGGTVSATWLHNLDEETD